MSTELSPDRDAFLDRLVATGCFLNRQQALERAVDLLRDETELLADIREGVASIERGEGTPLEEVDRQMRAKYNIPKDA